MSSLTASARTCFALSCLLWFAFDAAAATVTRGPFLQLANEHGVTVVLLTDDPAVAKVRYGTSANAMNEVVSDPKPTTEHVLPLSNLSASTRYWYEVEIDGAVVAGGPDHTFRTYPEKGSPEPFRFIAWGDSGNGTSGQLAVARRMTELNAEPAFGLILGDIIYPGGEAENYDPYYFAPYRDLLRRMAVWPTIGNHDVVTQNGAPYLDAFHLPTNNPAGTELYYSWDYGNVHFVCLDTHRSSFSPGSAQLQWLAQDLAASNAQWKIVYFHVPPYSGGTHADSAAVKNNILPVLEEAGVDVVFSGHSHVYERTFLLKANTVVQNNVARYDQRLSEGSIYVVSGSAGMTGPLSNPNHPLMAFQKGNTLGASVIEVSGPVLRGYFLDSDNEASDLFTLLKNNDTLPPGIAAVRAPSSNLVEVTFDEPVGEGATALANYTISPPVAVTSAVLQGDGRTVLLHTEPHPGGAYRLDVSGIRDTALPNPNPIPSGSSARYNVPVDLVPRGGTWRYLAGSGTPPPEWVNPGFADGSWGEGQAPLGYGENGIATTLPSAITAWARAGFDLGSPSSIAKLSLGIRYDDGVVVYLNGAEVARRGVPAGQTATTVASISHEADGFEAIDLTSQRAKLVAGRNVLAVEVHNVSADSSDLLLDAELRAEAQELPPPFVVVHSPADGMTQVPVTTPITAMVRDEAAGIDPSGIRLALNGEDVAAQIGGTANERTVSFIPVGGYVPGSAIAVELRATNAAGISMAPVTWSFVVESGASIQPGADAGAHAEGGSGGTPGITSSCGCMTTGGFIPVGLALLLAAATRRRSR